MSSLWNSFLATILNVNGKGKKVIFQCVTNYHDKIENNCYPHECWFFIVKFQQVNILLYRWKFSNIANKHSKDFWIIDFSEDFDETKLIYFISLVGSNVGDYMGYYIPKRAFDFFEVKSEMELHKYGRIFFQSRYFWVIWRKDHYNGYRLDQNIFSIMKNHFWIVARAKNFLFTWK